MDFLGRFTRNDGELYFTLRIPVKPTGRRPNVVEVGSNGDDYYLYADRKNGAYVIKHVGSMPDPERVKLDISLENEEE